MRSKPRRGTTTNRRSESGKLSSSDRAPLTTAPEQPEWGVVVGGASGIGRAVVSRCVDRGSNVLILDRDVAAARQVAGELGTRGPDVDVCACDVRVVESLERAARYARDRCGQIRYLVLTFGITEAGGICEGDPERWRDVLETNVSGVAHCLRGFGKMIADSRGQAVVIASLSGRESYAGQPMYIASKWAVTGLAHSVRKEWRQLGVRVTVIAPGIVDTPMSRSNPFAQPLFESIRPLTAEDVAEAVDFVLTRPAHVLIRELQLQPLDQDI